MIDIETYCGICGEHCCRSTEIDYRQRSVHITIECPECKKTITELEEKVEYLKDELNELLLK